jgi:hypothetical protein
MNSNVVQPSATIVPVFAQDNGILEFLGTAFFVEANRNILLTAHHVIRNQGNEFLCSYAGPDKTKPWFNVHLLASDADIDVAVLESRSYSPQWKVALEEADDLVLNRPIVCHEYSGVRRRNGGQYETQAATRLGNVTRMINMQEDYGKAGESMLELSFPALQGASGAPVLFADTMKLYGIIKANAQYHAIPAQIATVLDEKNDILETIHYHLPQGLAVHLRHIRRFLTELSLIGSQQ